MKRDVRPFLILGCALVIYLELPQAIPIVRAAFDGPYPVAASEAVASPSERAPDRELVEFAGFAPSLPLAVSSSTKATAAPH